MPAVDADGNVYVNSEDGNLYMLPQGHTGISTDQGGKIFLDLALGAAYTPLDWPKRDDLHADQRTFFVVSN
jgi:hypothetical protein